MSATEGIDFLIVYGTTEGQTRKIASWVHNRLEKRGYTSTVWDSTSIPEDLHVHKFDGVMIMGSVHQGHYQSSLVDFINTHLNDLQAKPGAFLSVSLAAVLDEETDEAAKYVDTLKSSTGWQPTYVEHVAGALLYTQYDFFKRQIMKLIVKHAGGPTRANHDYEFTQWDELGRFVDDYCEKVKAAKPYSIM